MRAIGLLSAILLLGFQPSPCYQPIEGSWVWIEGRSTVNQFTCTATRLAGQGMVEADGTIIGQLIVPVRGFDCGRAAMNRDLQEALQADRFPEIRFEPERVEMLEQPAADSGRLDVAGALTIAGTTRRVRLTVTGQLLPSGRAHLTGSLPLKLTDFNVKPPTALLGLIRVHDRIAVHFELVVQPVSAQPCAVAVVDSLNQP